MPDPLKQETRYGSDRGGRMTSLTDPKTNLTSWTYDVQGRLISKRYPDTRTYTYVYETTTSRLKALTDAASGQELQLRQGRRRRPSPTLAPSTPRPMSASPRTRTSRGWCR